MARCRRARPMVCGGFAWSFGKGELVRFEVVAPALRRKQPWLVRSGQVVMLQRATQKKPHEASVSRLSNAPARRARGELVPDVESREVAGSVSAGVAPTQCDADPAEDEQMLEVGALPLVGLLLALSF